MTLSIIRTRSGRILDPANPKPESININDIAHALSQTCRWGGQCKSFYSVAQHSLHVVSMLPAEHKLAGLLHDASEAYFCDLPKPLKVLLPDYQKLELNLMNVIAVKYGFNFPLDAKVHDADEIAMYMEAEAFGPPGLRESLPRRYPPRGTPHRLEETGHGCHKWEADFIKTFNDLL